MGTCVCLCEFWVFMCPCVGVCVRRYVRVCICVCVRGGCACVCDAKIRIVIVLRRFAWTFVPRYLSQLHVPFSLWKFCATCWRCLPHLKNCPLLIHMFINTHVYSVSDNVTSLRFFQWHEYTSLFLSDTFFQFMSHIQFVTNAVLLVAFCLEYSSTRSRVYFYPTLSCKLLLSDNLINTTTASHLHSLLTFSIQYISCWWWQVFISCWLCGKEWYCKLDTIKWWWWDFYYLLNISHQQD